MDEKISAELRVVGCTVKKGVLREEVIEVKASGDWESRADGRVPTQYPISLHLTAYPGCAVIPSIGDNIKITIERA